MTKRRYSNDAELQKKLSEQKKKGYPNFKNAIAQDLIENHNIDPNQAREVAFSKNVHDLIVEDVEWAQHMGTEYWAELIADHKEHYFRQSRRNEIVEPFYPI